MATQSHNPAELRPDTTPVGIQANSGVRVRNRPIEELEQDLAMVYHALLMVTKGMSPQDQVTVMKSRLIGMRGALQAACELAAADREEEWTMLRARVLGAARYHFNRDGVKAAPRWRTKTRRIV